jgi:hypothetical protein
MAPLHCQFAFLSSKQFVICLFLVFVFSWQMALYLYITSLFEFFSSFEVFFHFEKNSEILEKNEFYMDFCRQKKKIGK